MAEPLDNYTDEEIKAIVEITKIMADLSDEERQDILKKLNQKYGGGI